MSNDRILEPEIELPEADAWAGEDAIRSCTGASLNSMVEAFLAQGGTIQEVAYGVRVDDGLYPATGTPQTMAAARKNGAKVSIAARRVKQ